MPDPSIAATAATTEPEPLNRNELAAMQVLQEYIDEVGRPPTRQELADEIGASGKARAHHLVMRLVHKGWLRLTRPNAAGNVVLLHRVPLPDFSPITFVLAERLRRRPAPWQGA